jgi:hypothetical protein
MTEINPGARCADCNLEDCNRINEMTTYDYRLTLNDREVFAVEEALPDLDSRGGFRG